MRLTSPPSDKRPSWFSKDLRVLLALVPTLVFIGMEGVMTQETMPFDVGDRSQLFIDKVLVHSAEGVTFTLHPAKKHPAGPWLYYQKEKKQGPVGPMVIYDKEEKLFKSWSPGSVIYNTSRDGLTWEEPEKTNDTWRYIVRVRVIKDTNDPDPARRYKLLAFSPSRDFPPGLSDSDKVKNPDGTETLFWYCKGYNTYVSADGRILRHLSQKPILLNAEGRSPGDMLNAYYDNRHGLFVAFLKMTSPETKFTKRRCFAVLTSKDFETWSEPNLVLVPDQFDDDGAMARLDEVRPLLLRPTEKNKVCTHIYGVGGPYQQESCTIIFLWTFIVNDSQQDGPSEVQLAISRDLKNWERPFRQAAIPRGKVALDCPNGSDDAYAKSDWDSCWFNNVGPGLDVGDEVWVYYHAANTPHNHPATFSGRSRIPKEEHWKFGPVYKSGLGLAVWKRDRFVSVDAPASGGTLTTVPIIFSGTRLELNAATQKGGEVVVEFLDKENKILARSKPFRGDSLHYPVKWDRPLNLATWAGKPVWLRFRMKAAELYAFAFRK